MKKLLAVLALLLAPSVAFAAASTITTSTHQMPGQDVRVVTFTAVADTSDGTFLATASEVIDGYVFMVVTNPSASLTADYDIVLTDTDGIDVMGGMLANRHTTASEQAIPKVDTTNGIYGPRYVQGAVTLGISNNSDTSAGVVIDVYVAR